MGYLKLRYIIRIIPLISYKIFKIIMKLGGRKNLFAVLVMIWMMLTSNVIQAQPAGGASRQSSGNAGGHKHGIPSGSWGGSTDVTSSRSTREVTEGRPGQWSPKAPPLQTAGSTNKGGNESRKLQ